MAGRQPAKPLPQVFAGPADPGGATPVVEGRALARPVSRSHNEDSASWRRPGDRSRLPPTPAGPPSAARPRCLDRWLIDSQPIGARGGPDRTLIYMTEPWRWDTEAIRVTVGAVRACRSLAPRTGPGGATAAVALSFDSDHETISLRDGLTSPGKLSQGEYGARAAVPRILTLLNRHEIALTGVTGARFATHADVASYVATEAGLARDRS